MIELLSLLELGINKPSRVWNFNKYIPKFYSLRFKIGDVLINVNPNKTFKIYGFNRSGIKCYDEKGVKLEISRAQLERQNNRNKSISELQVSKPTLNIDGQYGDITIITNGPLAGKEVELLMTDEGDEYKLTFSDVNKDYIGLDLHDYVMFIKWLKAQRIKFTAKAWEIGSYLEPDDMSDDSIDGIDVFIPEQYIKFL